MLASHAAAALEETPYTDARRRAAHATPSSSKSSPHVPVYEEELWTSQQRQACSIHEVSYRACFKPQLPAYFIERLSDEGDVVYDPFSGRGTTAIEVGAARTTCRRERHQSAVGRFSRGPRLEVPHVSEVDARLNAIDLDAQGASGTSISRCSSIRDTERELLNLRAYLNARRRSRSEDAIDRWIRMVATNRLTGHSPGFFSVYTLPPNQAVSAENQIRSTSGSIKSRDYRNVRELILRKSIQLQSGLRAPSATACGARPRTRGFSKEPAATTRAIDANAACSSRSPRRRSSTWCSTRKTTGCAAGSTASTRARSAGA